MVENYECVNKQNEVGWTALMLAAHSGHHECVDLLIKAEADVNKRDNAGCTALMCGSSKVQRYRMFTFFEHTFK